MNSIKLKFAGVLSIVTFFFVLAGSPLTFAATPARSPKSSPTPKPTPTSSSSGKTAESQADKNDKQDLEDITYQVPRPTPEVSASRDPVIEPAEGPSLVQPYRVSYALSPLGLPVPFKHGLAARYTLDPDWMLEASYFTGSLGFGAFWIDVGSIKESIFSLGGRYFPRRGSFNWIIGISHQSYRATLGDQLVARLSNTNSHIEVLNVEALGLQAGLGNEFKISENFVLGVDWVVFNLPLVTTKTEAPALQAVSNEGDRGRIEDALGFLRYIPTAVLLKTSIGYRF